MALAKLGPSLKFVGTFFFRTSLTLAVVSGCTNDDSGKKNQAKQASPAEQAAHDDQNTGGAVPAAGADQTMVGSGAGDQPASGVQVPVAGDSEAEPPDAGSAEASMPEAPNVEYKAAVVRDFRQYSQNLAVVTGIALAEESIQETIEEIMYSLPANNDVEGYTPFNQIAMLRLAHSFCNEYWAANSATIGNMSEEQIVDVLLERFDPHSLDDASRAAVRTEMLALMRFRESGNSKEAGFLLSCSAFLASAYFTFF